MGQINLLAVMVCAFINMALGAIWYSLLFNRDWVRLTGLTAEQMHRPENIKKTRHGYIASLICYLILACTLAILVTYVNATTLTAGMELGFICWLGFTVTTYLPNHLFSLKPLPLALINLGYPLVGMCLMGALLAVWR